MKLISNIKVFALFLIQSFFTVAVGLGITKSLFDFSKTAMGISVAIVLVTYLLLYIVSNYKWASIIGTNIVAALVVVNFVKVKIRNTPLIFSDVKLINEMANVKNLFTIRDVMLGLVGLVIFNGILIVGFRFIDKKIAVKREEISKRMFAILLVGLTIFAVVGLKKTDYDYNRGGVVYNFYSSIVNRNEVTTLSSDEKKLLEQITQDYVPAADYVAEAQAPNIIMIMNEAFWDVNLLEKSQLTPDPMALFYRLQEEGISGYLEVPVFGGGTSNTEFEVLTGYSTHIYDDGYMMYTNEMSYATMSLASVLKAQGYKTMGLHSFWGWYYDRNSVYKKLGFDEFIVDEYMNNTELKGYYISDDSTTNEIIEQIEDSEAPAFIYCITMQNHGPYDDKRYDNYKMDIAIESDMPLDTQELTQVYGQGVYDASKSLQKLVDYAEASDEKTVILFFGDHLPLMGDNLKTYKDNDFINENQSVVERALKLSTVPFVLWSNYKDEVEDIGIIDATFLGPYVLDYAEREMPNYYRHVLQVYDAVDFISRTMLQDKEGNIFMKGTEGYDRLEKPFSVIQKDMLYGSKKIEDDPDKWIDYKNEKYNENLEVMVISDIIVEGSTVRIIGNNLYQKSRLFINETQHDFKFENSESIIVEHVDLSKCQGKIDVKLQLFNTIEKVVAESNDFRKDILMIND